MPSLVKLVADLTDVFERLQMRYALGGALAANYWGIVRTTLDIDCLVLVPALKYQDLADALQSLGCRLRNATGDPIDVTAQQLVQEATDDKLIECFRDSVRIELFVPVVPLQDEVLRRAVRLPLENRQISVTTAEDLILLKMAFHRPKDLEDVRGILWVQRGKLDLDYMRLWSSKTHTDEAERELLKLIEETNGSKGLTESVWCGITGRIGPESRPPITYLPCQPSHPFARCATISNTSAICRTSSARRTT